MRDRRLTVSSDGYRHRVNRYRLSPLSAREAVGLDVLIAAGVGGVGVWRELAQEPEVARLVPLPVQWRVAVQIVGALLLLRRRQSPFQVGIGTAVLCLLAPTQSAPFAAYSIAAHGTGRRRVIAGIAAIVLAFYLGGQIWRQQDPLAAGFVIGFGAVLGLYVHARRALLTAAVDRAEAAEREQYWRSEQAAATERSRLAGEMHDVLSHRLNLLLLQAGALAQTVQDPPTRRAVEDLRASGALALGELRDVFGALASTPASGIEDRAAEQESTLGPELAELTRQCRESGVALTMTEVNLPERLSPTISRTALRVVQEGLTNAAKHAAGSPVDVRVVGSDSGITISVINIRDASEVDDVVRQSGGGRGLTGLRERTELVGGSLVSASRPEGGFEVSAWLPSMPGRALDPRCRPRITAR